MPVAYNVLLVDEDPKELELFSHLVREVARCKIDVMSQASDFLEWIDRSNYHLIIITETALELLLLEQIKRITPATSVIIISAQATIEQAVAAIRLGAEDYLAKPFNVDSFQLAVKRGLDRKLVFEENISVSNFLHLLNSCQMISGALEQKKILEIVQSYISRELNAGYSSIYSLKNEEPVRIEGLVSTEHHDKTLEEILDISLRSSNPLAAMVQSTDFYRFIERGSLVPGVFIFRFKCVGQAEYFCICLSPEKPASMEGFESRLRLLKAQIEVTGKNIEQYIGVQHLVYVDDATGLYNTRYLNYILDREIAQSNISKKSFAVLFIDADKFKAVNDTYGHLVGTKLLNELGNHLKKYVRERDTVFRYGGDEFVAVLTSCDLMTAKTVAERIRESVEKKVFLKNENLNIHFTISIGVALFPKHAKTKKDIIEVADHAMFDAKRSSRNSVSVTGSGEVDRVQKKEAMSGRK
ncbi:MAG: diguanylate cyclase [Bdellovibrionia bacterium]